MNKHVGPKHDRNVLIKKNVQRALTNQLSRYKTQI